MGTVPVTTMIFTLNEELHLPGCLDSLAWCSDVIVVDSFSSDGTEAICRAHGVRFYQHPFAGFGSQRNWAFDNIGIENPWVLVLDADERVPAELVEEMSRVLSTVADEVAAFRLKRRFYLWGRWLRYSSLYPTWVVRLVRHGRTRYIDRGHAETQQVDGRVADLQADLIDENLKGIDEWFERQNRYSRKDAEYELEQQSGPFRWQDLVAIDPLKRRASMKRLAAAMPARPLVYFLYSYFWRRGFLDGRDGLVFCMMKAIYQAMVQIKKYDLKRKRIASDVE